MTTGISQPLKRLFPRLLAGFLGGVIQCAFLTQLPYPTSPVRSCLLEQWMDGCSALPFQPSSPSQNLHWIRRHGFTPSVTARFFINASQSHIDHNRWRKLLFNVEVNVRCCTVLGNILAVQFHFQSGTRTHFSPRTVLAASLTAFSAAFAKLSLEVPTTLLSEPLRFSSFIFASSGCTTPQTDFRRIIPAQH